MFEDKEQNNKELIEKAAEELAWLFISAIEQKVEKKKLKKKYEKENSKTKE